MLNKRRIRIQIQEAQKTCGSWSGFGSGSATLLCSFIIFVKLKEFNFKKIWAFKQKLHGWWHCDVGLQCVAEANDSGGQTTTVGSYSRGYLPGRRSHRSTRYMGQPQLSSGIEHWQPLKGLPSWEEIPQIYPVHGAATTFFRYRTLAATQGVTCLGGDSTDLPGTWGGHNFLQV